MARKKLFKVLSLVLVTSIALSNAAPAVYAEDIVLEEEAIDEGELQEIVIDEVALDDTAEEVVLEDEGYSAEDLIVDTEDLNDVEDQTVLFLSDEDEAKVNEVISLITNLPNPDDVKLSDKAAIEKAQSYYDALSEDAKAEMATHKNLVTKLNKCVEALEVADQTVSTNEVIELLKALPDPSAVTVDDADAIKTARKKFDALSTAAQNFIPEELTQKLIKCEAALDEDVLAREDAGQINKRLNALKDAENITLDDEAKVVALEKDYAALSDKAKGYVDEALLKKLTDARTKIDQLKTKEELEEQINGVDGQGGLINKDNYYGDQQAEIDKLIADAKAAIEAATTKEEMDRILEELKEALAKVKTKDRVDADKYEAELKGYPKKPSEVTINDKENIQALRDKYEALSAGAKAFVNTDEITSGETYISRLQALEKAISDKETAITAAQKAAEEALLQLEKVTPTYYTESGIEESYNGINGMLNSKHYDAAGEQELRNIIDEYVNKINNSNDIDKINSYKDEALNKAKEVKDIERKQADAFEAELSAYKNVNDLNLHTDAKDVKKLVDKYNALPSYAKKYVDTNEITSGETYKQRLDALQSRIDELAEKEAKSFRDAVDALPDPENVSLSDEQAIKDAENLYNSLADEAKAKVPADYTNKLKDLREKYNYKKALTDQKSSTIKGLQNLVNDRTKNTGSKIYATFEPNQLVEIRDILNNAIGRINAATTNEQVNSIKAEAEKKIMAVKTKAQLVKARGIKTNFNRMKFRSTKQAKKTIWLRWNGFSDIKEIKGFQIYGGKKSEEMRLLRQYDYRARSAKFTDLKKGTEYKYMIYAFTVVDGEIIKVAASPVIYATTKGTKYGTVTKVKVTKVGKKTSKKVKIKKGKTAKIKAKEVKNASKLKRRRKIAFESTNTKVATVTSSGKIKAVAKGTAWIRVYSQSGKYKSVKVTVK